MCVEFVRRLLPAPRRVGRTQPTPGPHSRSLASSAVAPRFSLSLAPTPRPPRRPSPATPPLAVPRCAAPPPRPSPAAPPLAVLLVPPSCLRRRRRSRAALSPRVRLARRRRTLAALAPSRCQPPPAPPSILASVSPDAAAATPSLPSPPYCSAGLRQLGAANSRASSVASSTPPTRGPHPVGPPSSRRAPTWLYPLLGHLGAAEPRDSSAASSTPRLNENGAITPLRSGVTAPNCGVPDVPPRRVDLWCHCCGQLA
ncbi:proline-rich receptor-like protein kinase PERK2 [Panicum virgatum]|uniref:proline-rich receptor-like protein kinase PERK2 n=1 Tax=Panicum virgatum TaxID=38727 RepID=UPI0019D5D7D0|nr:proline-rich receptor-like protein kinase PERK2 [Panicum virgatum]